MKEIIFLTTCFLFLSCKPNPAYKIIISSNETKDALYLDNFPFFNSFHHTHGHIFTIPEELYDPLDKKIYNYLKENNLNGMVTIYYRVGGSYTDKYGYIQQRNRPWEVLAIVNIWDIHRYRDYKYFSNNVLSTKKLFEKKFSRK